MASRAKRRRSEVPALGQGTNSQSIWQRRKWWLIGAGVGAIALLVVLTYAFSGPQVTGGESIARSGSTPSIYDFPVDLYQGGDVVGSEKVQFASLLGDRPIVLNYWASNCPPCSAEMPEFQKAWQKYSDRVLFFGLDVGRFAGFGGPEESKRELRRLGVTYPAAPVPDLKTVQDLRVIGLPSTDFITPNGKVVRNWTGILNQAKLEELVENLLNAS